MFPLKSTHYDGILGINTIRAFQGELDFNAYEFGNLKLYIGDPNVIWSQYNTQSNMDSIAIVL